MLNHECTRLRRALAARGVTPAHPAPDRPGGRDEEAEIRPARLIEDVALAWHDVGRPECWTEPVGFLNGTGTRELVGYAGTAPIVVGEVAAAVRRREDGRLRTVVERRRRIAVGRPAALAAAGDVLGGFEPVPLDEAEPAHPARDLLAAAARVDRARANLELAVGDRYRHDYGGWLVVDGSIAESPAWAADPCLIGISGSHAALPFDGAELERYLRLPAGHRTSLFEPASRRFAPVHAWALRLWPWEGRDLFHGLVRVEVAPALGTPDAADRISRRLLAERVPVSAPHPRWDRLLYGIRSVEEYLRARR